MMLKTQLKDYEVGAEDFIQRPYEDSELLIKIKLILGTKISVTTVKRRFRTKHDLLQSIFYFHLYSN